ncbi:MAG: magnesium transporter [bacterium]|nr:magnesium transporter [bacterium]
MEPLKQPERQEHTDKQEQFERTLSDWPRLDSATRIELFRAIPLDEAEDLLDCMNVNDQTDLLTSMSLPERRSWLRYLDLDDIADILSELPEGEADKWLELLDARSRDKVSALLAYAEDDAGGLMDPRFARVRSTMTVEAAINYLHIQAQEKIPLEHVYVLDSEQKLLGEVGIDTLLAANSDELVIELADQDVVTCPEDMDQEEVGALFARYSLTAMPVVDEDGHMKGLITADDVVDVILEEGTEDAQKYGGMEALDESYMRTGLGEMIHKRAGWLVLLLIGEMFTASAMAKYQQQLEAVWYLAIFVPLITSSGGNSGSQASALMVRAMAMGEVKLRDWWRVFLRESSSGLVIGIMLGLVGLMRVLLWNYFIDPGIYGSSLMAWRLGATVSLSLVGVVLLGCIAGSMLPFILSLCKQDPASASAPFVATIVDVSGLTVYFTIASLLISSY